MVTWASVSKIARALPDVVEARSKQGHRGWSVKGKSIAWERPLRRSDLEALGDAAPKGEILCAWVPDLETKEAMVSARAEVYFTTPHFRGYPMVLVKLGAIAAKELRDVLDEAWRCRAPKAGATKARAPKAGATKARAAKAAGTKARAPKAGAPKAGAPKAAAPKAAAPKKAAGGSER